MRYLVLGTGAAGCVFGGLLSEADCGITFVALDARLHTMKEAALRITGILGGILLVQCQDILQYEWS